MKQNQGKSTQETAAALWCSQEFKHLREAVEPAAPTPNDPSWIPNGIKVRLNILIRGHLRCMTCSY